MHRPRIVQSPPDRPEPPNAAILDQGHVLSRRHEQGRVLALSPSTAVRWIKRWTTTGSVAALPGTGHSRSPLKVREAWLVALVAAEPDLTLEEIRARLRAEKKLKIGTTAVCRFYDRHKVTFKKNAARSRAESS